MSTCSQSAPSPMVFEHAAPRAAKSALSIEGAMIAGGAIVSYPLVWNSYVWGGALRGEREVFHGQRRISRLSSVRANKALEAGSNKICRLKGWAFGLQKFKGMQFQVELLLIGSTSMWGDFWKTGTNSKHKIGEKLLSRKRGSRRARMSLADYQIIQIQIIMTVIVIIIFLIVTGNHKWKYAYTR